MKKAGGDRDSVFHLPFFGHCPAELAGGLIRDKIQGNKTLVEATPHEPQSQKRKLAGTP